MVDAIETDAAKNPFELAILVSERVQIQTVVLVETRAESRLGAHLSRRIRVEARFLLSRCRASENPATIMLKLSFSLRSLRDGEIEADPTLFIEAIFSLGYSLTSLEGLEDRHLDAFAHINGIFNAWPYWREYVQSMSTRMAFPIIAPVFRFPTV